jgi:hypothetical protein
MRLLTLGRPAFSDRWLRRRMIALAGPIFVVGLVVTKLAINEQKQTDRADEPVLSH